MSLKSNAARACLLCRNKKIRCDSARRRCKACETQNKEPTFARISDLERERAELKSFIVHLRNVSVQEREVLLSSTSLWEGQHERTQHNSGEGLQLDIRPNERDYQTKNDDFRERQGSFDGLIDSEDEGPEIAQFISINESGNAETFGPSSALHLPVQSGQSPRIAYLQNLEHRRNSLIANAALQRQAEHNIGTLPDIAGAPTETALHLLDVHWARQHHTFLLTYRPAIMRDLRENGPNSSPFLLNALFACSSKFSEHRQIQQSAFFTRCDELIKQDSLLMRPTIPTVVGLLLLGSTYNARGETSKGWLLTGYALRMVYDLGLHLDPQEMTNDAELIEVRRRVFWGAFVCDKLQSLYLGRPPAINLRDCQVSREFLDTFEEKEAYISSGPTSSPIYSVSTFVQLCLLSKIMTVIINRFYAVGASFSNALSSLQTIETALERWREKLPKELDVQWDTADESSMIHPPPNVLNLHVLYQSLIILLHRPFISDGHLRSRTVPFHSWEQCTLAAKNISAIVSCYKRAHNISKAPYLMAYCTYVACTIHVRNAASRGTDSHLSFLIAGLECLDTMCNTNPGVRRPADIIRKLIVANNVDLNAGKPSIITSTIQTLTRPGQRDLSAQSAQQLDLELIFGTFGPSESADFFPQGSNCGIWEMEYTVDPLFGVMNSSMMPPHDLSSSGALVDDPII